MSHKQKNIALIASFLVMLIIAYQFSFKKTFELKNNINKLSKDKALLENAESKIGQLQQENRYFDAVLKSNDISADQSFGQNLFQKVTKLGKTYKLTIVSFEKPHIYKDNEASLLSYVIEVKGDFRDLMLFSNDLEQLRLGKFSSMSFTKKKNYKTRRNELRCKLILQKLSK